MGTRMQRATEREGAEAAHRPVMTLPGYGRSSSLSRAGCRTPRSRSFRPSFGRLVLWQAYDAPRNATICITQVPEGWIAVAL